MTVRFPLRRASYLLGAALILAVGPAGQPALAAAPADTTADGPSVVGAAPAARSPLAGAFERAAARYRVPADLLAALGYAETRLDGHGGAPSASGGYGVMHLTSNPKQHTLDLAATLTGLEPAVLRTDTTANILGAAAVLRSYADAAGLGAAQRTDVNHWYLPLVRYGGATDPAVARLYADAVYDLLGTGFGTPADQAGTGPRTPPRSPSRRGRSPRTGVSTPPSPRSARPHPHPRPAPAGWARSAPTTARPPGRRRTPATTRHPAASRRTRSTT